MSDKEFVIPFVGLKQGVHEFNFEIGKAFFESIEYSIVLEGNVYVTFLLDKKETMLIGDYTIRGTPLMLMLKENFNWFINLMINPRKMSL